MNGGSRKRKNAKWWGMIIGSIICTLFLVIGIPIIINEVYKAGAGYITLWGAADVLSFYAVILSGLITIGVLAVTIYYNKKDTEKQINLIRAQTNVPFFVIDKVCLDNSSGVFIQSQADNIWVNECEISRYKNNVGKIKIELRNIGDGIAIDPHCFMNLSVKSTDSFPKFVQKGDVLIISYDVVGVLVEKVGVDYVTKSFSPFDTCLILTYQNTLGVVFKQEITLQHIRKENKTAVELRITAISHQFVSL